MCALDILDVIVHLFSLERGYIFKNTSVISIYYGRKQKTIMDKLQKIESLIATLAPDFAKFYNDNNNAAGTRVRKGMQELKTLAQDIRVEVQNKKNEA